MNSLNANIMMKNNHPCNICPIYMQFHDHLKHYFKVETQIYIMKYTLKIDF